MEFETFKICLNCWAEHSTTQCDLCGGEICDKCEIKRFNSMDETNIFIGYYCPDCAEFTSPSC
jgi:hypothetical protein